MRDVVASAPSSHDRFTYGSVLSTLTCRKVLLASDSENRWPRAGDPDILPYAAYQHQKPPAKPKIMTRRYCSSTLRRAKLPGRRSPLHINFTQLRYRDLRIWFTGGGLRWQYAFILLGIVMAMHQPRLHSYKCYSFYICLGACSRAPALPVFNSGMRLTGAMWGKVCPGLDVIISPRHYHFL